MAFVGLEFAARYEISLFRNISFYILYILFRKSIERNVKAIFQVSINAIFYSKNKMKNF